MRWKERNKLLVLMALQLLWGLVLWFSISKYGLGVSTDAVHLLFGGLNLASGNGLTSYDGTFLSLWPPLYPVLLTFVRMVTGMEMLGAAALIQVLAFLGLSFCSAVLFLRIFDANFGLAIAATVLAQAGSVVLIAFGMVGPDYVHLFLVVLLLVLTGRYVESGSGRTFVALAAVALLATMQRYLGVAAVATSVLTIVLLARGSLRQRLGRSMVLCSTAVPMAIWLAITSQLYTRRDPISLAENFSWFSKSILEWFFGPSSTKQGLEEYIPLLWVVLLLLAVMVIVFACLPGGTTRARQAEGETPKPDRLPYLLPLLLYGSCYSLALFGSASVAYFNKLGGRFLLPLYLPLITLPVVASDGILRTARRAGSRVLQALARIACCLVLAGLAVVLLRTTCPLVIESHANGATGGENAFNNRKWRDNAAMRFWLAHKPDGNYLLFSNEPDGVAFNTQHATRPAPRKRTGPYGTEEIPLSDYMSKLFGAGTDAYLLWIEPSPQDYYYRPDEVQAIADVVPLFTSDAGSVYQLRPKAP